MPFDLLLVVSEESYRALEFLVEISLYGESIN